MQEKNRQFVIFGNFNSINFDNLEKLKDLKERYGFQTTAVPDISEIPINNNMGRINVNGLSVPNLNIRPAFQSEDKRKTIFFGSSRIHIEEIDTNSDTYEEFNRISFEIIELIIQKMEVKINRVAINGQLVYTDEKMMQEIYTSLFKTSFVYGESSEEWQFRVVTSEPNDELNIGINKIATYVRGTSFDDKGNPNQVLVAGYDFNTRLETYKTFDLKEIKLFNKLGCEYRKLVIKI